MARRRCMSVLAVGLALLSTCAMAACGGSDDDAPTTTDGPTATNETGASSADAKGTLTVGYLDPITGVQSPYSSRANAQAAIDAVNAAGGVNGHKIELKVYDVGDSTATGVAAVRQAINDRPLAVLSSAGSSAYAGASLLAKSGIPGFFGVGAKPWLSSPSFFAWPGRTYGATTTAWVKYCLDTGGKKIALPGSAVADIPEVADGYAAMAKQLGGDVVYKRVGLDTSTSAQIATIAQQIKDSGAQCVVNLLFPGGPQLKVALNQLGVDIPVVVSDAYGPEVEKQFGSSVDGLLFANYFTSIQNTSNPGVKQYLADMAKYQPKANPMCICVTGYATTKFFLHVLGQVKGEPTADKLKQIANQTDGYDIDGLVEPIRFPRNRSEPGLCLGYSEMKDGKWTAVDGGGVNGMVCGEAGS